jgi:PAS domain S-box-containing protein
MKYPSERSSSARYLTALLAPLFVALLLEVTWPFFKETPVSLFLIAVMFCAWYGGLGPGLVSVFTSFLIADFFFIEPYFALWPPGRSDLTYLVMLVAVGSSISGLSEQLHRSRRRSERNVRLAAAAKETLQRSQEQLLSLIEQAPISVALLNRDMRYIVTSDRWVTEYGRGHTDLTGRSHYEIHPDLPERWKEIHQRALAGEFQHNDQDLWLQADGTERWLRWSVQPWRKDGEEIGGIIMSSEDITDSMKSSAMLRRQASLFDEAYEGLFVWEWKGPITFWNRAAERLYGYTRAEAIGNVSHELLETITLGEGGSFLQMLETVGHWEGELEHTTKEGTKIVVESRMVRVDEPQGSYVLEAVRDISERKRAADRLKTQLSRLELLQRITRAIGERQDLMSIYQVVVRRVEEDMPVDFCCVCSFDPTAHALTILSVGINHPELLQELTEPSTSVWPIDENGLSRCVKGQLVYEPDASELSKPFMRQLARAGLKSVVLAPLRVENTVFGIIVAARRALNAFGSPDCEFLNQLAEHVGLAAHQAEVYAKLQRAYDDLKSTQQAVMEQERLRVLGQMASGIAHDINNSLSPVTLYVEQLLESESNLSVKGRNALEVISRAIDDASQTIGRMREFYRRSDDESLLQPVDLNLLVTQVIDLTRARWQDMPQQKGSVIKIVTNLQSELPMIVAVESEIREALTNMIFNAVDAMPDGGAITFRTQAAKAEKGATSLAIVEVSDNGAGMDEATRMRCYEPFFTTKGERGTGLGMAMVYGTVQRHNADIEIESEVNQGTTIRLKFPVGAHGVKAGVVSAAPLQTARPLRILTIDDDPLLLKSLSEALQLDGHSVIDANGGQAGIDAFLTSQHDKPFDVVITDLGMPQIDGRQVAAAIKNVSPATPIILFTGWGQRLTAEGDVPLHVDRVLNKPPKLRDLREALAQATAASKEV